MSVFRNFREAPGRRVFEGALSLIFLSAILITSGCVGVVSGNGGPGNQPTPQGAVTISNIEATAPTSSGFQVGWLTNVPADSQIDYGTSAAYGSTTPLSTTAVTVHHVTLSSLTTGTLYHYRVRSSDSKKNQALSGDFTFATSGDTTPPTVSITSPASGATLTGTVTVVANAQDNVSVADVQFKVDGTNSGPSLAAPPYSYSLSTNSLSNGNHTLTATAIDGAGNTASSAGVPFVVNNSNAAPPVVSITAPAGGATVSGTAMVTASATSSIGVASVQFQLDGANVGSPVTAAPYSYSWDTTKSSNGSHTLKAIAKDTAENSTTSAGDTVNVKNTVAAPVVSITAPANGATVSGTAMVTASATSSIGVASVQFQLDGADVGSPVTAAPYSYSWDTTKSSNGSHTLKAIAKDTAENSTTSAGDTVNVKNTVAAPVVSITAPANGATVSGTATLTASATSSIGVASVQFQLDAANVGSPITAAPYIYSWDTAKSSNGSHTLRAIAKDTAGTSTTSAGDTVKVNNAVTPPAVSITAPASGAIVSGTATVTASATSSVGVASVQFQLDGANVGGPVTAAPYTYSWDTTKSSNGSHTLKAVAKDTAGTSTTSIGDTVAVNNAVAPPQVSITAPASGATVSGTITVSGTASSSLGISSVQITVDSGGFSSASGTNTWSFSLNTASLSNATHTLTAKVTDSSGGTASSSVVSITVNNVSGPTVTINWSDVHQEIDGFGASSASTGDGITNSQADLFWSTTNGVGLSLLRVQIESNGTYPDLATMQKAQDRGVRIWGTPWSPPATMKSNGNTNNGGSLLASDYQAVCELFVQLCSGLKELVRDQSLRAVDSERAGLYGDLGVLHLDGATVSRFSGEQFVADVCEERGDDEDHDAGGVGMEIRPRDSDAERSGNRGGSEHHRRT